MAKRKRQSRTRQQVGKAAAPPPAIGLPAERKDVTRPVTAVASQTLQRQYVLADLKRTAIAAGIVILILLVTYFTGI
ncbi:MAG: hypothetical protein Q8O16_07345 [Dehalococcoidia bacterium]|nr:hypothetical protein [Dehalococcoidia bacterium]